jgi:hypothetical protein
MLTIYLDEQTGSSLDAAAKKVGEDPNTLVRKIICDWLAQHERTRWPDEVLKFQGIPDFIPFEEYRHGVASFEH